MKTDADSGEADKPPETNSKEPEKIIPEAKEETGIPVTERTHAPQGPGGWPEPVPEPSPLPGADGKFRKTELWDRPPHFRSEVPVMRENGIDRQLDEIHDRIDILEDRFELVIDRIERRISKLEEKRRKS